MPVSRFTRGHVDDILRVAAVGEERLEKVRLILTASPKRILTAHDLQIAAKSADLETGVSDVFPDVIFSLAVTERTLGLSTEDVLDNVSKSISFHEREAEHWTASRPAFKALLSDKRIQLGAKLMELTYSHVNSYRDCNLVVDARPIFDEKRDEIVGHIVLSTMILRYGTSEGTKEFEAKLDINDVRELRDVADRALNKIKKLKNSLQHGNEKLEIHVAGDSKQGE